MFAQSLISLSFSLFFKFNTGFFSCCSFIILVNIESVQVCSSKLRRPTVAEVVAGFFAKAVGKEGADTVNTFFSQCAYL